eukprot:264399_1
MSVAAPTKIDITDTDSMDEAITAYAKQMKEYMEFLHGVVGWGKKRKKASNPEAQSKIKAARIILDKIVPEMQKYFEFTEAQKSKYMKHMLIWIKKIFGSWRYDKKVRVNVGTPQETYTQKTMMYKPTTPVEEAFAKIKYNEDALIPGMKRHGTEDKFSTARLGYQNYDGFVSERGYIGHNGYGYEADNMFMIDKYGGKDFYSGGNQVQFEYLIILINMMMLGVLCCCLIIGIGAFLVFVWNQIPKQRFFRKENQTNNE